MDSVIHAHMNSYEAFLDADPTAEPGDDSPAHLVVRRDGLECARVLLEHLGASVSMTWSNDYKAFAVSWSDGGSIGNFHTKVLLLHGHTFEEVPAATRAFKHFEARHDCAARGDNLQAYRFEKGSKNLMLVLSVYPTGDCGLELGHTEGYLVRSSDGAILRCINNRDLNAYMRQHPEGS